MNAAFLLVTTAWLAGGDAPPPPKVEPPPPAVAAAPVVSGAPCSSCGGTTGCGGGCSACDSGCGEREGLFAKLKARFARGGDCGCAAPAPACSSCDSGCGGESFWSKLKGKFSSGGCGCEAHESHHHADCGCNAAPACGCESGPSFFERLKAKFARGGDCGCDTGCSSGCSTGCSSCGGTPAYGAPVAVPSGGEPVKPPKDGDPGKKLPEGKEGKEVHVPATFQIAPASQTIEQETKNPFELDRRYETRVDRAADYSWLTGQLFYVHADGGLWVLRYAPLSKEDSNGGGVVLARDLPMDSYREGDLVTVHGAVLKQRGAAVLGAPLYQASSIELVERSQP